MYDSPDLNSTRASRSTREILTHLAILAKNSLLTLLWPLYQGNIFITCFHLSSCSVSLIVKPVTAKQFKVSRYFSRFL